MNRFCFLMGFGVMLVVLMPSQLGMHASIIWCLSHTHPFNGPLSGTTQVSRYQKGKTNLDFTGARDSERQWYQLGHMQVCTSLQTDNHASSSVLKFFTGRMPFLPPNQQCQSTEGKKVLVPSQNKLGGLPQKGHST